MIHSEMIDPLFRWAKVCALSVILMLSATAFSEQELEHQCPELPSEVNMNQPNNDDFVTVDASSDEFLQQNLDYMDAYKQWKEQYASEFEEYESAWDAIHKKQTASETKFLSLMPEDFEQFRLLVDVQHLCWTEVMGVDELEKAQRCIPPETPPSDLQWTQMLICSMDKAQLLNIEITKD